jgi:hypothetical protein
MAVPNLVPLLGSISGMLAGPELAQRTAAALGIAGTPAGSLLAGASPKAIGAGIASLGAGAEVDEAVQQALKISASEAGSIGQPNMQMGGAAPMPAAGAPMSPPQTAPGMSAPAAPQQGMPPQGMPQQGMPPQGMPPQGMPQQGMPQQGMPPQMPPQQQPTMNNAFPQVQAPQSLGTGLGTLRPQQRPPMGSMTKGLV